MTSDQRINGPLNAGPGPPGPFHFPVTTMTDGDRKRAEFELEMVRAELAHLRQVEAKLVAMLATDDAEDVEPDAVVGAG